MYKLKETLWGCIQGYYNIISKGGRAFVIKDSGTIGRMIIPHLPGYCTRHSLTHTHVHTGSK